MQIEGTKLIFIMNISVIYFIKFASRMPQIAQILVSTFKIFRGSMPPDPPRNFLFFFFFFFFSNSMLWLFQEITVSVYCHLRQFSCIIIINARLINISMIETNSYRIPLDYDLWCRVVGSLLLFWGVGLLFWGVGLLNFFWGVNRSGVHTSDWSKWEQWWLGRRYRDRNGWSRRMRPIDDRFTVRNRRKN